MKVNDKKDAREDRTRELDGRGGPSEPRHDSKVQHHPFEKRARKTKTIRERSIELAGSLARRRCEKRTDLMRQPLRDRYASAASIIVRAYERYSCLRTSTLCVSLAHTSQVSRPSQLARLRAFMRRRDVER
eukprot:1050417-Rhodomonas_salina.2